MMYQFSQHRRRRGFTFVELMVSLAISSLVFMIVAGLQSVTGRGIKDVYAVTRTRSARMIALDQIRYILANGRVGTVVATQADADGGFHQITFVDPTKGGVTSAFAWNTANRTLTYDDDINSGAGPRVVVRGPIDINFTIQGAGEIIQLRVRSAADIGLGGTDTQDGITSVYLRNT